jgi:glutamate 5-kinase
LTDAKRVVVKVGSALLVDAEKGRLNRAWLESFAADIAAMRKRGQEVILVSSGAIALGRRHLGLNLGQAQTRGESGGGGGGADSARARLQGTAGGARDHRGADSPDPGRHRAAPPLLECPRHLEYAAVLGAVPVINENDTVATAEIRYGDNDRLAARVAQMVGADCLVLLSDIDGLVHGQPARGPQAEFIARVLEITPAIEAMAGGAAATWEPAACRPRSPPPRSPWARAVICASPRGPFSIR